jgi:hypothetical protein
MNEKRQPIPDIKPEDIERIVRRDFPESQFDAVTAMLSVYGVEQWHRERHRVQAATLKLANGNLEALRKHIEIAKRDYRDVLVVAEYPEYWKGRSANLEISHKERSRIIDRDWQQYQAWLNR